MPWLQALNALTALNTGSLVRPPMTRSRFADLMNTRVVCEGAATEQPAAKRSKSDLAGLAKSGRRLTKVAQEQDIVSYLAQTYEFKFQIYEACGSESLLFLIEALGRGDGAAAAAAIRRDISDGAAFLLDNAEFH